MVKQESHRQLRKHAKELLLLFGVPVGIIISIIAFLYVPRLFANPTYNFVYCEGYSCEGSFSIAPGGQVAPLAEPDRPPYYREERVLYYYDVQRDASKPITENELAGYRLDTYSKSPDGYTLKRTSGGSGFLFWSDYRSNWSLSKGLVAKPITLNAENSDATFVGWVLP